MAIAGKHGEIFVWYLRRAGVGYANVHVLKRHRTERVCTRTHTLEEIQTNPGKASEPRQPVWVVPVSVSRL